MDFPTHQLNRVVVACPWWIWRAVSAHFASSSSTARPRNWCRAKCWLPARLDSSPHGQWQRPDKEPIFVNSFCFNIKINLFHLELDRGLDLVHFSRQIVIVGHNWRELASLVQTGTQNTRNLPSNFNQIKFLGLKKYKLDKWFRC